MDGTNTGHLEAEREILEGGGAGRIRKGNQPKPRMSANAIREHVPL